MKVSRGIVTHTHTMHHPFQLHVRSGVSDGAGHRLLHLGHVAEHRGSGLHGLHLPVHCVPETALNQEIYIDAHSHKKKET